MIKRLSDTLRDLDKLNQGEYNKYQLFSSKIDMARVYMLFLKKNRFKTVPAMYRVIKRLSDTLSDLDKLKQGEYSKYQLCRGVYFSVYSRPWGGSKQINI